MTRVYRWLLRQAVTRPSSRPPTLRARLSLHALEGRDVPSAVLLEPDGGASSGGQYGQPPADPTTGQDGSGSGSGSLSGSGSGSGSYSDAYPQYVAAVDAANSAAQAAAGSAQANYDATVA